MPNENAQGSLGTHDKKTMNAKTCLTALLGLAVFAMMSRGGKTQAVPSPRTILGNPVGERFSRIPEIRLWFQTAASRSRGRMKIQSLGRTTQGQELFLALISSESQLTRLNTIGKELRSLVEGDSKPNNRTPAVVWLSFGVHGNEPSPSEAAMDLAYRLLTSPQAKKILSNLIIVLDPCLNPDGRERYVSNLRSRLGKTPDPDPLSFEHRETWPGGRTNHYLQDLNRDWAFQTQTETKARIRAWLLLPPQVHVDFHEMWAEREYFFFPAELPVHHSVPRSVLRWHKVFGKANAKAFDAKGWRFYSGEDFDLFYPGYGDSWPSLMGAVGMTYEVGGHGNAALAYRRPDGRIWTLTDRSKRHSEAGWTTLKTASANKDALLQDFYKLHRDSELDGRGLKNRFLVLSSPKDPGRVRALGELLLAQGLKLSYAIQGGVGKDAEGNTHPILKGSLILDFSQARGRLARALLDQDNNISHLYFYDVSAWSLPLAYGIQECKLAKTKVKRLPGLPPLPNPPKVSKNGAFILLASDSGESPLLAAKATKAGLEVRVATKPFRIASQDFGPGSLVIPTPTEAIRTTLNHILKGFPDLQPISTQSSMSQRGPDLGSPSFASCVSVRAALAFGEGTDPNLAGALWFLFENRLRTKIHRLPLNNLSPDNLNRFNLVILPDGGLPPAWQRNKTALRRWVREGGIVLAIGSSARAIHRDILGGKSLLRNSKALHKSSKKPAWTTPTQLAQENRMDRNPGAIIQIRIDSKRLLAAGYGSTLPVLVQGRPQGFPEEGRGRIVAFYGQPKRLSGFIPSKSLKKLEGRGYLLQVPMGKGSFVLFDQNPQFRLFWHGLTRLLLNASFLLPRRRIPPFAPPSNGR
jgi:hypothetical protein